MFLSIMRGSAKKDIMTKEEAAALLTELNGKNPAQIAAYLIKKRIGSNRNHGWGAEDSLYVMEGLWLSENGDSMPDTIREQYMRMINPSATRQYLESKNINLLDPSDKKRGKGSDALAKALTA